MALVRLVACVGPTVSAQRGVRHEPFATLVAAVRSFARMSSHVLTHTVFAELLVADGARDHVCD